MIYKKERKNVESISCVKVYRKHMVNCVYTEQLHLLISIECCRCVDEPERTNSSNNQIKIEGKTTQKRTSNKHCLLL